MTRILVVEDEPGIAVGLEDDLKTEGYEVEVLGDGAIEEAFRAVKRSGTVVIAGLPTRPWEFAASEAVLKGVTIRGSYLGAPSDLEEVFRLASEGVGLPRVTTHELAEAPALLESLERGELQGRAVVVFD